MDSSMKIIVKLSRKGDLKGIYLEEYLWRLILCYTSSILSCILKENFQKPMCWIFLLFSYPCWIKFELIHLPKNVISMLILSSNVRLKVTRVFCTLISRVYDTEIATRERVLHTKLWIKQNIILLLFICKIHITLYCKVLKVFNFKIFSSF